MPKRFAIFTAVFTLLAALLSACASPLPSATNRDIDPRVLAVLKAHDQPNLNQLKEQLLDLQDRIDSACLQPVERDILTATVTALMEADRYFYTGDITFNFSAPTKEIWQAWRAYVLAPDSGMPSSAVSDAMAGNLVGFLGDLNRFSNDYRAHRFDYDYEQYQEWIREDSVNWIHDYLEQYSCTASPGSGTESAGDS